MNLKPIIIVPYRDREQHLSKFLFHMGKLYSELPICIIEQTHTMPFNRGKLLNIGYLQNPGYTHYIMHDVDMLPIGVDYAAKRNTPVLQLASSSIQLSGYLGGVTRFSNYAFKRAGGYNNAYYHRAEDNEMAFNLSRLGMNVINRFGKYYMLDHERKGPEFDPALWQMAQLKRHEQNQLSICEYGVLQNKEIDNVRHIVVSC